MRRHFSWIGLSLLLPLSACSPPSSENAMPDFKQNPNPKQSYQLTLTIANAPGPFESLEGFMQFDVKTPECLPPPNDNGGHPWPTPTEDIRIAWTRINDTEYTGAVYIDGMINEDYYGRGTCHWELIQAYAVLRATGANGETQFMPNISPEKLKAEQSQTTYFVKQFYPRDPDIENYPEFGQTDRSKMASTLKDDELFTVTLASKATTQ